MWKDEDFGHTQPSGLCGAGNGGRFFGPEVQLPGAEKFQVQLKEDFMWWLDSPQLHNSDQILVFKVSQVIKSYSRMRI